MGKIVMGTSIAPHNIEKQIISIKSWIESSFQVISFNCKEEIEILEPYFCELGVEFVEISRNAELIAGKKVPFIDDILKGVSRKTKHICGFFNSDIYLKNVTSQMYQFIYEETNQSLVFTRRNEVLDYNDIEKMNWKIHFDGLDLFFVDRNLVQDLFDDGFFVQTTWSACFLEKCRMKGIRTKEMLNPIAFHKRHSIQWNFETNNRLIEDFCCKYYQIQKGAFERALNQYYCNLLMCTEKICFGGGGDERFLFVTTKGDEEIIKCIQAQEDVETKIANSEIEQSGFDYTVYIKGKVYLEKVFCKLAIYLMDQFSLSQLNIGRFFVSEKDGINMYNNLNRNMSVVEKINEIAQTYTVIYKNDGKEMKQGRVYLPVSYEKINLSDSYVVRLKPTGVAYLMPAGVRASEWYEINKERLNNLEIKGFLDNNPEKVGKNLGDRSICNIEELTRTRKDFWVILASKYYSTEIKKQLLEIVNRERILDVGYILEIDSRGNFYSFDLEEYKKQCL